MMVWVRELTCCVGVVAECRCCNFYTKYFDVEGSSHVVIEVWVVRKGLGPD